MARALKLSPIGERVAVVEAAVAAHNATNDRIFSALHELRDAVAVIGAAQAKQKSFIGGVIFTISAVWAVIIAGIAYLKS